MIYLFISYLEICKINNITYLKKLIVHKFNNETF